MQGLALKWQLLFLFCFFVIGVFVSRCLQTFTSALVAVVFTVVGLSVIDLGFSWPVRAFHSLTSASPAGLCHSEFFTLPSHRRRHLLSRFVVPSVASHSFTSASPSQGRLVIIPRVLQESHKSGYVQQRVNKLLVALTRIAAHPSVK